MIVYTFGVNETRLLDRGWHEREGWDESLVFRYTKERATVRIEPEWAGRVVALLLSVPNGQRGVEVSVGLEGDALAAVRVEDDRWRLLEAALPAAFPADEPPSLTLEASPPFIPDRVLHNGDQRVLGVRVAAIRIK